LDALTIQVRAFFIEKIMEEKWEKCIKESDDYYASNLGRIKSYRKNSKGKILKQSNDFKNYKKVHISPFGKKMNIGVHRLVAYAFIANPENKKEVNHKDGNPSNNNVNNLEWVTSSENTVHSYNNGLQKRGELFYSAKLTQNEAIEIINAYNLGVFSQKELAIAYNISVSSIKDLLCGRNWAHLGIQKTIRVRSDRVVQYH
jgi:hypothetical protein